MTTRRRGWNTPAAIPAASPLPTEGSWCWCGNQVVARCVDCGRLLCERHRIQEGQPPPDLLYADRKREPDSHGPPWPYHADMAWNEAVVDPGWLGFELAEQLFLGAYAERPDLALCRDCRARAGLELIAAWRATTPPADGWERAWWLMEHGFEPLRVAVSVDAGPPRTVLYRFVAVASRARPGTSPAGMAAAGAGPDQLTIAWRRDRKGRVNPTSVATGWALRGEATVAMRSDAPSATSDDQAGPRAHLFVSADGEAYVYGRDCDPSTGRVASAKRRRSVEYRRLSDDRWHPGRLAMLAFLMSAELVDEPVEDAADEHEPIAGLDVRGEGVAGEGVEGGDGAAGDPAAPQSAAG